MDYIAYCTKGSEPLVAQELQTRFGDVVVKEIGDKRIVFATNTLVKNLVSLQTVDDVGILLAKNENVTNIDTILPMMQTVPLSLALSTIQKLRPIPNTTFSITTSIIGNSHINPSALQEQLAHLVQKTYKGEYTAYDHTNIDIRVFCDHHTVYISLRLTKESLHRRKYKVASRIGALRPSVAAAMVLVGTKQKKQCIVVDNFCGSGTILCEAALLGHTIYGGDLESDSIDITRKNLTTLHAFSDEHIRTLNAVKTPWKNNFFDCAISNLPWDKQIPIKSITTLYQNTLLEYARVVKKDGTVCLLVSKPQLLIKHAKRIFPNCILSSYKLGLLGQTPTIIVIQRVG